MGGKRRGGEGEDGVVKGLGGAGIDSDIGFFEPALFGEGGGELCGFAVDIVTSAFGSDGCDGFACRFTRTQRIFVGVDEDGARWHGLANAASGRCSRGTRLLGSPGEVSLGEDGHRCGDACQTHERAAGDGR